MMFCAARRLVRRGAKRCHDDLVDWNSLQIGKLLTQRVALGRDPADKAMGSSQLLHHHVEVPIQSTKCWIVSGSRQCGRGIFLFLTRPPGGACSTVWLLAREVDDQRLGSGGRL